VAYRSTAHILLIFGETYGILFFDEIVNHVVVYANHFGHILLDRFKIMLHCKPTASE
jgi:hypothetical protein